VRRIACVGSALFAWMVAAAWPAAKTPPYFAELWKDHTAFIAPNDPLVIDLNADGANEIIVTDSRGRVVVFAGATGEILWSLILKGVTLTAPVVGHFWGDGSLDIAVADNRGFVHLFNGGDGRRLQALIVKTPVSLPPTVLPPDPTRTTSRTLDFHPDARDQLIIVDDESAIHCLVFDPSGQAGIRWENSLQGRSQAPASVGDVDGDGRFEVVVGVTGSRQSILTIFRGVDGTLLASGPEPSDIVTIAGLADVNADGRDEIFFGTRSAHLYGKRFDSDTKGLEPLWERSSTVQAPMWAPLIVFGESAPTTIVVQTENLVVLRRAADGSGYHQLIPSPITSAMGLASGTPGSKPRLVFGDNLGGIYDWWVDQLQEKTSVPARGETLGLVPILADFDGQPGAECLFCFPTQQRMRMVAFPDYPTVAGAIVWQTRGGNLWRTGWRDVRYYESLRQHYAYEQGLIGANLRAAEEALAAHAWFNALESSSRILDVDPHHPLARKLHRRAWVHRHMAALFTSTVAALAVLSVLLYGSFLIAVRRVGLKQAGEMVKAGQIEAALSLYYRLHQRFPTHSKTNVAMANLLIEQDLFEPKYASVFERAYADRPGDARLLRALSECYARSDSLSAKARDVYLKSLDVSARRAELRFLIGRSFLAERRFQDAARFLGEALVEGYQNEQVYQALADAYIELRYHQVETVPILEKVYPLRGNDTRFLAYLCEVYLANERTDELALTCAQQTLALDSSCDSAQLLYAQILLAHKQAEGAWRRVEALLRRQPDRGDVLRLASRCLIALDRRDDDAVQILEKALGHYPDNAPILAHLSHIFAMRGWFDPHAAAIHRHAAELCPNDEAIVEAMARLAEKENDKAGMARYLEKLIALGRGNRDVMLRLAKVYRDLGVTDERARKACEVAVQANPDDRESLIALGKLYITVKETSPAAVAVLGRLQSDAVRLPGLERQLIAALDKNAEYSRLIGLCDAYLAAHRDDNEVTQIRAHAYLATGQAPRAIEEYEQLAQRGGENDQVVRDLALAYAAIGKTDEQAISLYGRALRVSPTSDTLYRALGCALVKRGNVQDAIAQFRAALRARKDCVAELIDQCEALLKEDSSRGPLRWFLCEVLINCGRFREAIDQLRFLYDREPEKYERILEALGHILEMDRENVFARSVRGGLFLRLGRLAEARADLEEANRLQPNNEQTVANLKAVYEALVAETEDPEVRLRLGQIYFNAGDLDTALRCFQKAVRDYRFESQATREMGRVFMKKGLLDLALEEFQKLPMDDDLKDTLYQLGQMYDQRADPHGARSAYRLIFATDAGFRDIQQRYETLASETSGGERNPSLDRTMIISQLSEKAKQRYKLLEEIGRGAMGIVYRCMDSELDEIVALKILPDNLSSNTEALTRFRREARSARRLSHRNIVRIHDIGEELGRKYISMEFVEGTTLKALIRASGGLEIPRVLKYGCQILDGLSYAHSIGIVHRDIKPANIMISGDDEVKITDFGIAKILESTDATSEGAVVGTPLYMSPEQVRGEPVDHRADLYSLGILLYECIEGKPPFLKGDLAYSHLHLFPEPMEHGFPEINRIIMHALEKRKEERWPTAQAMLDALRALKLPE
jgi:tetratricopeptide (TPR) repeat protein